ncbi:MULTISPECIES: RimK family alpha-L-glutamate ligase [Halomicrobium]|uniref:Alpha-L-glutamate ligase, RimK family n=2 Tax=Halomicrobium mukohataei TaxID=57705 RepID=C7NW58_HALMD|nr:MULTISPECIES: RimK family alpha-L-glutamate ligase [Halomicrobium]ACV48187.1 alpha-L-glutamate ligase, RimK family [Halomicrobium mukohataei DSM 12286]QCD66610.1 RimK family alpha-L-glutamate ligase [Halomicrobium mukohataei]QFR21416.1 RimK family alpha-L-glutamate ligase [Halomicrobium sp. ZPS1]
MNDAADPTVGVLSLHNSKETKAILNAVDALGYDTEWLRAENTAVDVRDGDVTLEPDVDVVVNRLLLSSDEQPVEGIGLAHTLARLVPMLNPPEAITTALHKFATTMALAEAGVPVPDALLALSSERLNEGRARFGDRAVYKTAIGTHGGGTWLVDLDDPVNPQVGLRQAFLQEYLDVDDQRNHDLRVYVVDGVVVGAMNRYAPDGDWRTNVALGGDVEDVTDDLPPEVADMATTAADVLGLDYAGVDIIEGADGYFVLEVNPTAGFRGLFKATGTSPAPHIARLAIEAAGGSVADDDVERLAERLDDSRPVCTPTPAETEPREPAVVGYIEEVMVAGTRGTETVLAKSDTGATRTSIDSQLATRLGTGPIKDIVTVRSGSLKKGKSRPVVDLVVGVGGTQHTVTASIEDRGHMDYPLLLGRDILQHYRVDVTRRADADGELEAEEEEAGEE